MKLNHTLLIATSTALLVSGTKITIANAETSEQPATTSIGGMSQIVDTYYNNRLSEQGISISNVTTPVFVDGELLDPIIRSTPFDSLAFSNTNDYVNIRSSWNTNAKVVGKLYRGHSVIVLNKGRHWSKVSSGNVTGYIANKYLLFGEEGAERFSDFITEYIKVTCQTLNVRSEKNINAEIIRQIGIGDEYKIVENDNEWLKISGNSFTGYVHKDYVDISYHYEVAISIEEEQQKLAIQKAAANSRPVINNNVMDSAPTHTTKGHTIATYALQFVGNPYVWGGTSLTNGADCSGFVCAIYQKYGYSLPRTSKEQAKNAGVAIAPSISSLLPGDLIFYGDDRGIVNHVAMYTGNGRVVHASNQKDGIKTSKWNYRKPLYARRIIK